MPRRQLLLGSHKQYVSRVSGTVRVCVRVGVCHGVARIQCVGSQLCSVLCVPSRVSAIGHLPGGSKHGSRLVLYPENRRVTRRRRVTPDRPRPRPTTSTRRLLGAPQVTGPTTVARNFTTSQAHRVVAGALGPRGPRRLPAVPACVQVQVHL